MMSAIPANQEMPDIQPDTAPTSPPTAGMEVPVPLDALAMPGEDEKMNNPQVGDPVAMHAEGTVTRIEGNRAFVKVSSVNGKPLDEQAAKTTDNPGNDIAGQMSQLQGEAQQMDSV